MNLLQKKLKIRVDSLKGAPL